MCSSHSQELDFNPAKKKKKQQQHKRIWFSCHLLVLARERTADLVVVLWQQSLWLCPTAYHHANTHSGMHVRGFPLCYICYHLNPLTHRTTCHQASVGKQQNRHRFEPARAASRKSIHYKKKKKTATVKYSQINITVISLHVRWRGEVFACRMASGKKKKIIINYLN